jgi:hypothetical protein
LKGRPWIGLIWLRIGTSSGMFWTRWWTFGFRNIPSIVFELMTELILVETKMFKPSVVFSPACCCFLSLWGLRTLHSTQHVRLWGVSLLIYSGKSWGWGKLCPNFQEQPSALRTIFCEKLEI